MIRLGLQPLLNRQQYIARRKPRGINEERVLIEQDGCYIQLEDGNYIRVLPDEIVSPTAGVEDAILTEDGFELATEDGFTLIT